MAGLAGHRIDAALLTTPADWYRRRPGTISALLPD
jgi:hypothetical protein